MALTVEQLVEIKLQLDSAAVRAEIQARTWREDADLLRGMPPQSREARRKMALKYETEAAKCRGLIASIEEELGREKADT